MWDHLKARLTREEIRDAIRSRRGEVAALARELKVSRASISLVLQGKSVSARIASTCEVRAREILSGEV